MPKKINYYKKPKLLFLVAINCAKRKISAAFVCKALSPHHPPPQVNIL
jgi:hypothetical protein